MKCVDCSNTKRIKMNEKEKENDKEKRNEISSFSYFITG